MDDLKNTSSLILLVQNLDAGFGEFRVIKNVSLKVYPGEIVAIIGPNGAGKSTVLKTIMAQAQRKDGEIIFDGKGINKLSTYQRIRNGIIYIPQGKNIFDNLTVEENLELGTYLYQKNQPKKEALGRIYSLFPEFKSKRKITANFLSGGQKQLLAIARALMGNPKLLLLDEPCIGLAPKVLKAVFDKVKQLIPEGLSILMVEQNLKLVLDAADRIYVIKDGKVSFDGEKRLFTDEKLKHIFLE